MVIRKPNKVSVAILGAACLAWTLTGCSGTNGNAGPSSPSAPSSSQASVEPSASPEASASAGPKQIAEGRPVTLSVDLHGWMPTLNKEATPENPNVFQSTQVIADEFMKLHPNVTIEWARTKPVGGLQNEVAEWLTTQVAAGTAPAITFTWGNAYQERGWYESLSADLDTPNEYMPGNEKWRELFPDYLMTHRELVDAHQNLVAIPFALYSGPPTGYYINKDLFAKYGLQPPKTWAEQFEVAKTFKENGIIPFAPWGFFKKIELSHWNIQFSVGPAYAGAIMDKTDYNKDGQIELAENIRAVKQGLYSPLEHEYAKEVYTELKKFYKDFLSPGWQDTDYTKLWNEGKVAMKEEGVWALPAENGNMERQFEFGLIPPPLVTEFAAKDIEPLKIEFTEKGPFQPGPDLSLNVLKPVVENNPDLREAAIAFLKFLTLPENVSMAVVEQGAALGAVRGSEIPPLLNDWMNNQFPIVPKANWPGAFTDEQSVLMHKEFELWVLDKSSDETFFKKINDIQQKSADAAITNMKIDTAGW
ncbi:ABC transporter substrate-binding protein [Cohnella phaseoli]|uniref:ABC-type glycerol-3-phosphate transport system substrate-binding protein n=1 Tax=Cohnella phaseoli TaxID=456490 RepID=A0A3D9HRE5_9BACL|nr:extracellular solute-binding protein [Cohnella phaseoli]RED51975.1 ABC-type glycerol-3-phosphate transport system substrate-binding protein [Cohnella phaseoli]